MKVRNSTLVWVLALSMTVLMTVTSQAAIVVYDLVKDFANLNIPSGSSPSAVTQSAGAVWTYQYENVAHNHDGTYTMLPLGWNANYRGYGLASIQGSPTYPSGANVRAVVNANDNPNGLLVPNPPTTANYLQSTAITGTGSIWEPLVIVWTAPSGGYATINILAQNTSPNDANRRTNLSLDLWNGISLTVLDSSPLLPGGSSDTLSYALTVNAGDQIQIWRDSYVDQQGVIAFSGAITLVPEPSTVILLALGGGLLAWARRRR